MTPDDLQRIEQTLGVSLSTAVKNFLLNCPTELRTTKRVMGTTPDGESYSECAADYELCDEADGIIALNEPGNRDSMLFEQGDGHLIVGQGACDETYWVDLDDANGAVHRVEGGTAPKHSDRMADSLQEFAKALIESYRAE
jgi:hypothetical protein